MTLRELKTWLDKLPEEFLDFNVVNGEVGMLDVEYMYRLDKPVTTLTVDEENKIRILLRAGAKVPFNVLMVYANDPGSIYEFVKELFSKIELNSDQLNNFLIVIK